MRFSVLEERFVNLLRLLVGARWDLTTRCSEHSFPTTKPERSGWPPAPEP
ncbi:hypothetical protein LILAB_09285 [Corallococcus macrosporus]|uniref:Uncharacterized protein n=1 Tax=Myxococcus fulvus (strain ATCC BAA-855 / HW-1) TaxID=483219 RepID=F8CIA9_MYXFH|nr:hypothetical protein LILAB_09285 [Corallococcus macrosporus]